MIRSTLLLGLAVASACSEEPANATPNAASSTLPNGAILVEYSALPDSAEVVLSPDLEIGGADGPDSHLLSDVRGIEARPDGRIIVLDYVAQEAREFDDRGGFLANLASQGEGPGEIADANGLVLKKDGTLWLNDPGQWRFTQIDSVGESVASYPMNILSYGYIWDGTVSDDGMLWEPASHSVGPRNREPGVREYRAVGYLKTTMPGAGASDSVFVWETSSYGIRLPRGSTGIPFQPRPVLALDPAGSYWTGSSEKYELTRVTLAGDTLVVLRVSQPPVAVGSSERSEAIERIEEFMERAGRVDVDWDLIPEHKPLLQQVFVDDQSRLWVKRATADAHVLDLFQADGTFVGTLALGVEPSEFFIPVVRHGNLYTVVPDELDVPTVVRMPVPPAGATG